MSETPGSAEFLAARLDEDEAAAKALDGEEWEVVKNDDADYAVCFRPEALVIEGRADMWREDVAEWGARHDPALVLREVAAKRKILAMHEPVPFWGNNPPPRPAQTPENIKLWYCDCQCPDGVIEGQWPCETVSALLAIYSDHPDYPAAEGGAVDD